MKCFLFFSEERNDFFPAMWMDDGMDGMEKDGWMDGWITIANTIRDGIHILHGNISSPPEPLFLSALKH